MCFAQHNERRSWLFQPRPAIEGNPWFVADACKAIEKHYVRGKKANHLKSETRREEKQRCQIDDKPALIAAVR